MAGDKCTPPKPAKRVLLTSRPLVASLEEYGPWRGGPNGSVDYSWEPASGETPLTTTEAIYCDVEVAIASVVRQMRRQEVQLQLLTALAKSTSHGAIRSGLEPSAARSSRRVHVSGGQVYAFVTRATAHGPVEYVTSLTVPTCAPLRFAVAAGDLVIDPSADEVPDDVAAGDESGETVDATRGTYRRDLLAVDPRDPDSGAPQWYLLLGQPTDARTIRDATEAPLPAVPEAFAGLIMPMFAVLTRSGARGITAIDTVANRIR